MLSVEGSHCLTSEVLGTTQSGSVGGFHFAISMWQLRSKLFHEVLQKVKTRFEVRAIP